MRGEHLLSMEGHGERRAVLGCQFLVLSGGLDISCHHESVFDGEVRVFAGKITAIRDRPECLLFRVGIMVPADRFHAHYEQYPISSAVLADACGSTRLEFVPKILEDSPLLHGYHESGLKFRVPRNQHEGGEDCAPCNPSRL